MNIIFHFFIFIDILFIKALKYASGGNFILMGKPKKTFSNSHRPIGSET